MKEKIYIWLHLKEGDEGELKERCLISSTGRLSSWPSQQWNMLSWLVMHTAAFSSHECRCHFSVAYRRVLHVPGHPSFLGCVQHCLHGTERWSPVVCHREETNACVRRRYSRNDRSVSCWFSCKVTYGWQCHRFVDVRTSGVLLVRWAWFGLECRIGENAVAEFDLVTWMIKSWSFRCTWICSGRKPVISNDRSIFLPPRSVSSEIFGSNALLKNSSKLKSLTLSLYCCTWWWWPSKFTSERQSLSSAVQQDLPRSLADVANGNSTTNVPDRCIETVVKWTFEWTRTNLWQWETRSYDRSWHFQADRRFCAFLWWRNLHLKREKLKLAKEVSPIRMKYHRAILVCHRWIIFGRPLWRSDPRVCNQWHPTWHGIYPNEVVSCDQSLDKVHVQDVVDLVTIYGKPRAWTSSSRALLRTYCKALCIRWEAKSVSSKGSNRSSDGPWRRQQRYLCPSLSGYQNIPRKFSKSKRCLGNRPTGKWWCPCVLCWCAMTILLD